MRILITRHGESLYNLEKRIGGDPSLSDNGHKYGNKLGDFFKTSDIVYTSTKKRVLETVAYCTDNYTQYSELDEINAGICEDLTYTEVMEKYPDEFAARKNDKINYRYPKGESYTDLVTRVSPVVEKILSDNENVFIVCHQAITRALLYSFGVIDLSELATYNVPLHHVLILTGIYGKMDLVVKKL